MIHVGFTGTRRGMSPMQAEVVARVLWVLKTSMLGDCLVAHHGDCVGADAQFHGIARKANVVTVEVHPGVSRWEKMDQEMRAFCKDPDLVHSPTGFLQRNRAIVDACAVLIAVPWEPHHQDRGGTWYTYDYAIKQSKQIALVLKRPYGILVELSGNWKIFESAIEEITK